MLVVSACYSRPGLTPGSRRYPPRGRVYPSTVLPDWLIWVRLVWVPLAVEAGPLLDAPLDPLEELDAEKDEEPLDLLDEALLDPELDEGEPLPDPEAEPLPELLAVAGRSLWTQTPSASRVLVPGMWMAAVRAGASIRTTETTSSSCICSSIKKSPGWTNSADANPHSSPRRIMIGCSGVALMRRLMTTKPVCSPRVMLATRASVSSAPCRPWCESQSYCAR